MTTRTEISFPTPAPHQVLVAVMALFPTAFLLGLAFTAGQAVLAVGPEPVADVRITNATGVELTCDNPSIVDGVALLLCPIEAVEG